MEFDNAAKIPLHQMTDAQIAFVVRAKATGIPLQVIARKGRRYKAEHPTADPLGIYRTVPAKPTFYFTFVGIGAK